MGLSTDCNSIKVKAEKQECVDKENEERRKKYLAGQVPYHFAKHDFEEKWDLDTPLDLLRASDDPPDDNQKRDHLELRCNPHGDRLTGACHKATTQQHYKAASAEEDDDDESALQGIDSLPHLQHQGTQAYTQQHPVSLAAGTSASFFSAASRGNYILLAAAILWVGAVVYLLFVAGAGKQSWSQSRTWSWSWSGGRRRRRHDDEDGGMGRATKVGGLCRVAPLRGSLAVDEHELKEVLVFAVPKSEPAMGLAEGLV